MSDRSTDRRYTPRHNGPVDELERKKRAARAVLDHRRHVAESTAAIGRVSMNPVLDQRQYEHRPLSRVILGWTDRRLTQIYVAPENHDTIAP